MNYSWKKFESVNQRLEHRITITRSGYIGFPTTFYRDNGIGSYNFLLLYFSEAEGQRSIGIKFITDGTEKGAIKIHKNKEEKGGWVVARNFFKINNIDYVLCKGRYEWTKENFEGIGELYILKLKNSNTSI